MCEKPHFTVLSLTNVPPPPLVVTSTYDPEKRVQHFKNETGTRDYHQ